MTEQIDKHFLRARKIVEELMKEFQGDRAATCATLTYAQALIFAVSYYNGEAGMTKEAWADEVAKIHLQAFLDIKPNHMGDRLQ